MRVALLVAVELFSSPKVPPVRYAKNDATALAHVLRDRGFDVTVLLDTGATKTAIESKLRKLTGQLQKTDVFCMFVASHGFSDNGRNFMVCHDTQPDDLAGTSLSLQWMFELLRSSKCRRSALFLDLCEAGVQLDDSMRGLVTELSDEQIREMFEHAEYCVGFAACKTDEKSHSSPRLGHGVWTYHLIQALSGNAKAALEGDRLVTSASLQRYLDQEVPREVRQDRRDVVQTPWMFGGSTGAFVVVDLGEPRNGQATQATQATPRSYPLGGAREIAFAIPSELTRAEVERFSLHLMTMTIDFDPERPEQSQRFGTLRGRRKPALGTSARGKKSNR